jgi:ribosomal protein S21
MLVVRKERETNQQVLRRFNRIIQMMNSLQEVRDNQRFVKKPSRFVIKKSAVRRDKLRSTRVWY